MANFDTIDNKINLAGDAYQVLNSMRVLYNQAKHAQALISRYSTDPAFKTAADFIFSASEIQELSQMTTDINTLVAAWEANHAGALKIG